jgi:hypothetical protein
MAQDTLLTKSRSPSKRCVCSGQFSLIRNFCRFGHGGVQVGVKSRTSKIQDFAHRKNIVQCIGLGKEISTKEQFQETLSGDKITSRANHESECEEPAKGTQGLEVRNGKHHELAPNLVRSTFRSQQETGKDRDQGETP